MKSLFLRTVAYGGIMVMLSMPVFVYAHVKWFAEEVAYVPPYPLWDLRILVTVLCMIGIISLGMFLERVLCVPKNIRNLIEYIAPYVLSLASIGFGIAFLIFTVQGFIFAPNLVAVGTWGNVMLVIQGIAGIMMLLGLYERIGGLLLIILFFLGIYQFGGIEMLDTFEMIGFAGYAMIVGRPRWNIAETTFLHSIMHRIRAYGYPLLRIGTGVNLIILGFTEKILAPSLTQNFLATHHWNFLQSIGVSDYWFAFTAGSVEILFGIFFILGLVTRLTTLVLAGFLITTLYLLGPVELVGHLPHFSIAMVLLVLGSGSRLQMMRK